MSQRIAPGQWSPLDRRVARVASAVVGIGLLWLSYTFGIGVVAAINSGQGITMWSAALVLAPLMLGAVATFPNVLMPLFVRIIDKVLTDTPPKA